MILGIDATNLRAGGGLTHLVGLLRAADPGAHGFHRVVVWGGGATLNLLPSLPWLDLRSDPAIDKSLRARLFWQRFVLPRSASQACDLLLAPGGTAAAAFRPHVVMCRNMLPFESTEAWRFGPGYIFARLMALRWAQANAFSRADGVIFLSDYAYHHVRAQLSAAPRHTAIVPHGVDHRFLAPPRAQRPASEFTPSSPFRLLYVSVVSPYKHQESVALAVATLRHEGFAVTIDFVGGSDTDHALRSFHTVRRRLDPEGRFLRYHSAIPWAELPASYHAADGFVFASSCENMPNILLEAMASGLPIASSDRGPMPEVLQQAGVYFNPEQPLSITTALRQLLSDHSLRDRCAHAAYTRATAYTWSRCGEATFAFLSRVARG